METSKDELNSTAEALWTDSGNPENQKRALEIFHHLYDHGDKKRAGYRLGVAYYLGRGAPKNLETAYRFLSLPELGQTRYALYYLGLVLKDPNFSGHDDVRARETLKQAHDLGVQQAAAHLEPVPFETLPAAWNKETRENYVREIIEENQLNEQKSGCLFSLKYSKLKESDKNLTYANFAVSQEAAAVSENGRHATLGRNVSAESLNTGKITAGVYKKLLAIEPEHRVIEYGCGSLRVAADIIRHLNRGNFLALDVVSTFFEIGLDIHGRDLTDEKGLQFRAIDNDGIAFAKNFLADIVYSYGVIFHIHPDDIRYSLENLSALATKPGSKLIFDAKITRDASPGRYGTKDKNGQWAWPLDFYRAALFPLELVRIHSRRVYERAPEFDLGHLEFHMPR